jgi:NADPH:quinone reductase-like Zn-dependent oxidoreductase
VCARGAPAHAHSRVHHAVVQLAKLSGFSPIIATASPANFALVKALGATHVVDRKLIGSLGAEIAKVTSAPVAHAYDAWSGPETQQALHDLLVPGGRLALVLPPAVAPRDGKTAFTVLGIVHIPANRALGVSIFGALEGLLAEGAIKVRSQSSLKSWRGSPADVPDTQPNPVEVLPGGLAGIVGGLERMAADSISGKKLVVRPQETV